MACNAFESFGIGEGEKITHMGLYFQGVQAQTVANFYLAFEADLTIIPVLNKIDLKGAQPEVVCQQINSLFDLPKEDVLQVRSSLIMFPSVSALAFSGSKRHCHILYPCEIRV